MPGAQLVRVKSPTQEWARGVPAPCVTFSTLHPSLPHPVSPLASAGEVWNILAVVRWATQSGASVHCRPSLPGLNRLGTPSQSPIMLAACYLPQKPTLPCICSANIYQRPLPVSSPGRPEWGQEPCSIREGRLGKRPSPLQQSSV